MEDSWVAGEEDGVPPMAFAADPRPGDRFFGYTPVGLDVFEVASLTSTAAVPAGFFEECLELHENPDDPDDADIILYARGVGRVSEGGVHDHIDLESVGSANPAEPAL